MTLLSVAALIEGKNLIEGECIGVVGCYGWEWYSCLISFSDGRGRYDPHHMT